MCSTKPAVSADILGFEFRSARRLGSSVLKKQFANMAQSISNSDSQEVSYMSTGCLGLQIEYELDETTKLEFLIVGSVNCIVSFFAAALNIIFVVTIFRRRRLRTSSGILLLALAFTDFLSGLIAQPLYGSYLIFLSKGHFACMFTTVASGVAYLLSGPTFFTVFMVSLERYIAILFPFFYERAVTKRKILLILLAINMLWVLWSLVALLAKLLSFYISTLGFITLPAFGLLVFFYCHIYSEAVKARKRISSHGLSQRRALRESLRAAKTTAVILAAFIVCYSPIISYSLVNYFMKGTNGAVFKTVIPLAQTLALSNSLVNAFVYFWKMTEARKEMRKLILGNCFPEPGHEHHSTT